MTSELTTSQDQWLLFQVLTPLEAEEFTSLLEVLLPHNGSAFAQARLATALSLDSKMVGDLEFKESLREGLKNLRQSCLNNSGFIHQTLEKRTEIISSFEGTSWFQSTLHHAKFDFYNRHIVWREIGYPDLGNESGYVDKGFEKLSIRSVKG
jgi:hypothetical protein